MQTNLQTSDQYREAYRPQFHFSPVTRWTNDPNGLVYYQGEYHLFYQYHPDSTIWGPMHWGHAVSKDLIHWTHLPVALTPDELGTIYSGSAVVDSNDSSGFFGGKDGLVAIFTHHSSNPPPNGPEVQSIAYSTDKGRTWTKYSGNPVIPNPGHKDFRDPKVFWHEPTQRWVLVVVAGDHMNLYTSPDLKNWAFASDFGTGHGYHAGVWECPDLFPLQVNGGSETKWVLIISVIGKMPGSRRMQYFIGDFDGTTFTNANPPEQLLWLDNGPDNYAAVTYNNTPDNSRILIGWMNNWEYARHIPTSTWRGAMTIPRQLELRQFPEGIRLIQYPVEQVCAIREAPKSWRNSTLAPGSNLLDSLSGRLLDIVAEFQLDTASSFGFRVLKSTDGKQHTTIGCDVNAATLFVDRSRSGDVQFHQSFSLRHEAPLKPTNNRIKLRILVDWSSVEVFGGDGESVISVQVFPDSTSDHMEVYVEGGTVTLVSLDVYPLKRIWDADNT